jgi:hypothetical protein
MFPPKDKRYPVIVCVRNGVIKSYYTIFGIKFVFKRP